MATKYSKEVAEVYSEKVLAAELTLKPVLLRAVGDIKGKEVLDLGCGSGTYSIRLARKGAKVAAIDYMPDQIKLAKKLNKHRNITYLLGNARDLNLDDSTFDLVFSNMVVPDIANPAILKRFFQEAYRVLKPKGYFIVSVLHPLLLLDDEPTDITTGFQKEQYFKDGSQFVTTAITNKGNKIVFNETHFSLSFVSKALKEAGFLIEELMESKSNEEHKIFLPKYLVIKAVK